MALRTPRSPTAQTLPGSSHLFGREVTMQTEHGAELTRVCPQALQVDERVGLPALEREVTEASRLGRHVQRARIKTGLAIVLPAHLKEGESVLVGAKGTVR